MRTLLDALVALDRELVLEGKSVYRVVQLEERVDAAVLRALSMATPDVWTPDAMEDSAAPIPVVGDHARERLARHATDTSVFGQLECAFAYRLLGELEQSTAVLDTLRQRLDPPVRCVEAEALNSIWNRVDPAGREQALEAYRQRFGEDETWVRFAAFLQVFGGDLEPEMRERIASLWFDPDLHQDHRAGLADLVVHEANLVGLEEVLATLPGLSKPNQVQVLERATGAAAREGLDAFILAWIPRLLALRAEIGDRVPGSSLLTWLMLTGDTDRGRIEADKLKAYPVHMLLVQGFFRRAKIQAPVIGVARFSADVCRRAADTNADHRARWLGVARLLMEGDELRPAIESELSQCETRPVGDFDLVGELGKGGAGVVYEAVHRPTGTPVAVKLLHSSRAAGELAAEARVQGRLFHPAVLRVLAAGHIEPCHAWGDFSAETGWMAVELAHGGSLFQSGHRPPLDLLPVLLVEILDALAHCHARGVLHLDLKPANLLLDEHGRVRLADFGIAGALGRKASRIRGTPAYSAPEVWEGGVLDQRTDLYGLGCMVYDLVVGMPPFMGSSKAVRRAHIERPFPKTDGLTAKDPSHRYRSAAAALAALPSTIRAQVLERQEGRTISATFTLDLGEVAGQGAGRARVVGILQRLPADWRARGRHTEWQRPRRGLGPLDAREVALVGREGIQDSLWAALHQVAVGQAVRVALVGREGVGRSAIARWLVERVRELDVAETSMSGGFPRVIDLGEEPSWPPPIGGVLHIGVCTTCPRDVELALPVPPLSNAALQQLALLWSVVEPDVLDSAVARSHGPAALRQALTDAPKPSPLAGSRDPHLTAAQQAMGRREVEQATAALVAFRSRQLNPAHPPTLARIRDAAVAMGLPREQALFGELTIAQRSTMRAADRSRCWPTGFA